MASWHRLDADGTLVLAIHVQPGAKHTEVVGPHGDALKVRVAAPALEDRANEALIAFLAERFNVPRKKVTLLSGHKARAKRFAILGATLDPAVALRD
jgi:TIGR00251 family protein